MLGFSDVFCFSPCRGLPLSCHRQVRRERITFSSARRLPLCSACRREVAVAFATLTHASNYLLTTITGILFMMTDRGFAEQRSKKKCKCNAGKYQTN